MEVKELKPEEAVIELMARVVHEINRAYCESQGDHSQVAWEEAPEWQKISARLGVKLHLHNPNSTPADSHASWYAEKIKDGWKYGEVKDVEKKEHPCMVPFDQLPVAQQAKDFIFRAAVHALKDFEKDYFSMIESYMAVPDR